MLKAVIQKGMIAPHLAHQLSEGASVDALTVIGGASGLFLLNRPASSFLETNNKKIGPDLTRC